MIILKFYLWDILTDILYYFYNLQTNDKTKTKKKVSQSILLI